ncbi:chemotaxis protein CheC [Virgibacillus doumboii]|uniref:chemotaxis protein CheC n=1 Tax=Virgibacillus doumboii TaxID=2697503 RepID=UPI0013DEA4F6|nr:chemotaxis protein CheC [Virgibacillus doumboii]
MNDIKNLTNVQMDVLREVGNIGAGNAATSMSKLINKKIDMQIPSVNIVSFNEAIEMIGGSETPIAGIMIHIFGDVPGKVYFILTIEEAEFLVKSITGQSNFKLLSEEELNEFAISALKESGNILTGSYISALSDFTRLNMQPSVPFLSVDMAGAVLSESLIEVSQVTDYAIIIDTKINDGESVNGIHGNFLFLPNPESFAKIFEALGIKENE